MHINTCLNRCHCICYRINIQSQANSWMDRIASLIFHHIDYIVFGPIDNPCGLYKVVATPISLIIIEHSQMASVEGVCSTTCSLKWWPTSPTSLIVGYLPVNHVKPSIDYPSICAALTNLRNNLQEMWPLRTIHSDAYL